MQVAGRVVRDPERWVDPLVEPTLLDGRPIRSAERLYLALNKPKGVVTSFGDPRGRRTVYDLLERVSAWVFPIGRLDRDSSGLLLLSNDSDFAEGVTSPAFGVPKVYRVTTKRRVSPEELAALARGVELDDGPAHVEAVELVGHRGPTSVLTLTIAEGRNREVRRMLVAVGNRVKELRRVAIGPVELGELPSGRWRELTRDEVAGLRRKARRSGSSK